MEELWLETDLMWVSGFEGGGGWQWVGPFDTSWWMQCLCVLSFVPRSSPLRELKILPIGCSSKALGVGIRGDSWPGLTERVKELINICFCSLLENLDRSPLNNAWKIYNFKKEKWYIFYTKKAAEKEKWMKAFKEERRRVREDAKTGKEESQSISDSGGSETSCKVGSRGSQRKRSRPGFLWD